MGEEIQTKVECVLWIDHTNRIISFQKVKGYEEKVFSSRDEKLAYAYEKGASGYRIQ